MSERIQKAKAGLVEDLRELGFDGDQIRALSPVVARYTARVVRAEIAMRDAAHAAMQQHERKTALADLFRGVTPR